MRRLGGLSGIQQGNTTLRRREVARWTGDTNNFSLARGCFAENSFVGTYRLNNPSLWIPLNVLPSTFLPETLAWLDRSAVDGYFESFKRPRLNTILFLNLICLGFCFWKRRCVFSNGIPALTILLTGIGRGALALTANDEH